MPAGELIDQVGDGTAVIVGINQGGEQDEAGHHDDRQDQEADEQLLPDSHCPDLMDGR